MKYSPLLVLALFLVFGCVSESEKARVVALEEKNIELTNQITLIASEKAAAEKQYDLDSAKQLASFQEYLASAYHYAFANEQLGLANSNYSVLVSTCNEVDNFQECYESTPLFVTAIADSSSKSVDAFTLAEKKLKSVNGISSSLLQKDIDLRLELIPLERNLALDIGKVSNAWKNYLGESDANKGHELFLVYEDLTKQMQDDIVKISAVGDKIDLLWEQSWFPTVLDENTS